MLRLLGMEQRFLTLLRVGKSMRTVLKPLKECRNRSGNLTNRKICFFWIEVVSQFFFNSEKKIVGSKKFCLENLNIFKDKINGLRVDLPSKAGFQYRLKKTLLHNCQVTLELFGRSKVLQNLDN